ncbi:ATP-binding protein [Roseateles sp. BYS180W]|uniref:histidine kinase n=1 Tax=Roseateles rivi TaxID=3299028 RepID=A0ABW7FVH9_9BURK
MSLFWRTFALLAMLLALAIAAWHYTYQALSAKPLAQAQALRLASVVEFAHTALAETPTPRQSQMFAALSKLDALGLRPAYSTDRWRSYDQAPFADAFTQTIAARLGPQVVLARELNGKPGLWVRFSVGDQYFWLQYSESPEEEGLSSNSWWLIVLTLVALLAAAAAANLINHPLRALSIAAGRIREGEFDSRLDESTMTSEIREVNMGFNRMARELAKMEQDRSVMLAGISHDLRTPLARLRLEVEMSVSDEVAQKYMAQDIDQLDAIINKFMDYARPSDIQLQPTLLSTLVQREAQALRNHQQIRVRMSIAPDIQVWCDPTELSRVLQNLFENARRYGHHPDEPALVDVRAKVVGKRVHIDVRDHGPGVPPDKLSKLTTPFYRGDTARTAATGAGLGLAIVEKTLQRMGGQLALGNANSGGFQITLQLRKVEES